MLGVTAACARADAQMHLPGLTAALAALARSSGENNPAVSRPGSVNIDLCRTESLPVLSHASQFRLQRISANYNRFSTVWQIHSERICNFSKLQLGLDF